VRFTAHLKQIQVIPLTDLLGNVAVNLVFAQRLHANAVVNAIRLKSFPQFRPMQITRLRGKEGKIRRRVNGALRGSHGRLQCNAAKITAFVSITVRVILDNFGIGATAGALLYMPLLSRLIGKGMLMRFAVGGILQNILLRYGITAKQHQSTQRRQQTYE
jgi:hypothetical protein